MVWRRVRDSNPRFLLREHIISSDAPSTSRTTLRAIFQPNFSNLNLGKWREKLERKLFNLFNCTAKTPINQGFSRRGFQSDHWFSSQPRYDHFDNPPCIFQSAFYSKNFWREKQERTLKNIRFLILKTLINGGFPTDETTKSP